jgi:hypothetical protein
VELADNLEKPLTVRKITPPGNTLSIGKQGRTRRKLTTQSWTIERRDRFHAETRREEGVERRRVWKEETEAVRLEEWKLGDEERRRGLDQRFFAAAPRATNDAVTGNRHSRDIESQRYPPID